MRILWILIEYVICLALTCANFISANVINDQSHENVSNATNAYPAQFPTLGLNNTFPSQECNAKTEQPCGNSTTECVKKELMCDGVLHCSDGSDELEDICHFDELHYGKNLETRKKALPPTEKCPEPGYFCRDGLACFEPGAVCDGFLDCRDGSDEGHFCYFLNVLRLRKT